MSADNVLSMIKILISPKSVKFLWFCLSVRFLQAPEFINPIYFNAEFNVIRITRELFVVMPLG